MKEIIIKTQSDLDKITEISADEYINVQIEGEVFINNEIQVYGKIKIDAKVTFKKYIDGRENSTLNIYGRENSTLNIDGRENSTLNIDGWGNSAIRIKNVYSKFTIRIAVFCCLWIPSDLEITVNKKSETSVIIKYDNNLSYLQRHGIDVNENKVILFKRVSHDFKTQENTSNETLWLPNTTLSHKNYLPESGECGENKFHACATPFYCDDFRDTKSDKYVAIEVELKDYNGFSNLYEWKNGDYPNKIAFGECKVLYECNRKGIKIQ